MKRLSGTRAIFLLIMVALLAGTIYFGVAYYQEYRREGTVEDDIATMEQQIAAMERYHDIDALEAELVSLQEQLAEAHFPEDVDSTLLFDIIRASATTAGIEDYSFSESGMTEKGVNGSDYEYRVYAFEVTAVGTLDEIFEFLGEIEDNMPYDAVKMQDVDLVYDSDTESWEITFEIVVFAQPA